MIRATFLYGNYDGKSKLPQFDLHLGANMWDTFKRKNVSLGVLKELIHVSSLNYLQICLVNMRLGSRNTIYICNEIRPLYNNKVSLQINLEKNPTNSSYIFILSVNFENLIIRLHILIISLILTKFQENQKSIVMSSNKCYNFKFL